MLYIIFVIFKLWGNFCYKQYFVKSQADFGFQIQGKIYNERSGKAFQEKFCEGNQDFLHKKISHFKVGVGWRNPSGVFASAAEPDRNFSGL